MTEIRPIRKSECEEFLELLCNVFTLDYHRAYDVFFSEPLFDVDRKWALFEGREMVSILTTTPLHFGWGRAFGIAGVATKKNRQREGHASRLLQRVLRESARKGEEGALLFARETALYEQNGFEALDRVIRAEIVGTNESEVPQIENDEVELIYNAWSVNHPDRLRRDAQRWKYWRWNYRIASSFNRGYVCYEPGTMREGLFTPDGSPLPLPASAEWFGTTFMADQLELEIKNPVVDLYLMGHNIPGIPQMFMTDQF